MKNKIPNRRGIIFMIILFFCSVIAYFICVMYDLTLMAFGINLLLAICKGSAIAAFASMLGNIFRSKNHVLLAKLFFLLPFCAICIVGLSFLIYIKVPYPLVFIFLLNVTAMLYAVHLLRKNMQRIVNE